MVEAVHMYCRRFAEQRGVPEGGAGVGASVPSDHRQPPPQPHHGHAPRLKQSQDGDGGGNCLLFA